MKVTFLGQAGLLFDFDGTISTLRCGWEKVMKPLMLEMIHSRIWQSAEESGGLSLEEKLALKRKKLEEARKKRGEN